MRRIPDGLGALVDFSGGLALGVFSGGVGAFRTGFADVSIGEIAWHAFGAG